MSKYEEESVEGLKPESEIIEEPTLDETSPLQEDSQPEKTRRRKFNTEETAHYIALLRELIASGEIENLTFQQMSEKLGTSDSHISKLLVQIPEYKPRKREVNPALIRQIQQYVNNNPGASNSEIADKFDVTPGKIGYWFREEYLERKSEAKQARTKEKDERARHWFYLITSEEKTVQQIADEEGYEANSILKYISHLKKTPSMEDLWREYKSRNNNRSKGVNPDERARLTNYVLEHFGEFNVDELAARFPGFTKKQIHSFLHYDQLNEGIKSKLPTARITISKTERKKYAKQLSNNKITYEELAEELGYPLIRLKRYFQNYISSNKLKKPGPKAK
jgi:hypothetical protein